MRYFVALQQTPLVQLLRDHRDQLQVAAGDCKSIGRRHGRLEIRSVRSNAKALEPWPSIRESVAAVFLDPGGLVDVLGVNAGPDIGINVADLGFHLILGEALILCRADHLVGQGLHSLPVSPRDKLLVGVDAVSEPKICEFTRLSHRLPLGGSTKLSVTDKMPTAGR
jgi:hypothetical protein